MFPDFQPEGSVITQTEILLSDYRCNFVKWPMQQQNVIGEQQRGSSYFCVVG